MRARLLATMIGVVAFAACDESATTTSADPAEQPCLEYVSAFEAMREGEISEATFRARVSSLVETAQGTVVESAADELLFAITLGSNDDMTAALEAMFDACRPIVT
jgi:hypothetical protein